MIKKADIFLAVSIILTALLATILLYLHGRDGDRVFITKNGETVYSHPLSYDKTVRIENGENIVEIKNGCAYMSCATCPDLSCVSQGKISKKGECIVCLPHGVIAEIK